MKTKIITCTTILFLMLQFSCTKEYLKKGPDEDLDIENVFQQRRYAESFLSSVYVNLPSMLEMSRVGNLNPFTSATDEMEITWTGAYSHLMNSGAWSSAEQGDFPGFWVYMYEGIRKANIFLENVNRVPMNEKDRTEWIGEATFLRAFYHYTLVRLYGAIPIIDRTIGLAEDFTLMRRQPVDKVIEFIVAECDKAAPMLEWQVPSDRFGRITRAAVLAMKSQALLHMASPLFNGNPDYANFVDNQGTRLFSAYDENRWTLAAQAAKECIDGVEANGYGLYYSPDNDPVKSYQELFLERNNREVLYAKNMGNDSHFERCANPTGYGGYSIYCPTQEMIDAYEMKNGEQPIVGYSSDGTPMINAASGYVETGYAAAAHPKGYHPNDISNMYVGRDPRFYASINYNGAMWKERRIEFWNKGIDGRERAGSDYCISGYLMKKMVNPTSDIPQGRFGLNTWIHYRLGEQYLNYAEALNEVSGPVADVYKYVNAIRARAGMPDLPSSLNKEQMRERIHHERRIELAFEGHRYFDVRRWKAAPAAMSGKIYGMDIYAGNSLRDDAFYKRTVIETRVFSPKHYLWPLQVGEIERNHNMIQNPGW